MDKAKSAVSEFMHKSGKHDTTVHENVAPAVTQETVQGKRHENTTTAVDREIHKDHHHTSVQPIQHQEVLPETHEHKTHGVHHTTHHHGNDDKTESRLARERAQFKDTTVNAPTIESRSEQPTVAGEHVHHHVHETIQPVVQKEVIQPHTVHHTNLVHETHHQAAEHHNASTLPTMTMGEFEKHSGSLGGRGEKFDRFEGDPKPISSTLGGSSSTTHQNGTTGSGLNGNSTTGTHGTTGSGLTGSNTTGTTGTTGTMDSTTTGTQKKAGLMDKINPKVDSNGDGKAGFMK